jgi:uncharacterized membrane protein
MALCANCGAVLSEGSGYCGSCGEAVGMGRRAPATSRSTGLPANVAGALAYALGIITGFIFLVLEPYKNDPFVRFHALQSIFLSLACVVLSMAWSIVWGILSSISGYFVLLDMWLRPVIFLGLFAFWLFLMYDAYQGREYWIPWVGAIVAKQVHARAGTGG